MKKFAAMFLILVLIASLPSAVFAKGPDKKYVDYVALGDSLAAGLTPDNELSFGYPYYLKERLEQSQYTVDFDNFGSPGYTTNDVVQNLSEDSIKDIIEEAEFITLDIGANDLLPSIQDPTKIPVVLKTIAVNYNIILNTIDSLNPDANVYVMGYYNPYPYAPVSQQPQLESLLTLLNDIIQSSAEEHGATFVPTKEIIAKRFETYLPNPTNIHLSQEGYQVIAKEFWKKLDKSKNGVE